MLFNVVSITNRFWGFIWFGVLLCLGFFCCFLVGFLSVGFCFCHVHIALS